MFIRKIKKTTVKIYKKIPTEIFIFIFAVAYRIPSLGRDIINNDAFLWKERGYEFGSALTSFNFGGTAVTYHPGVSLLWSQFIAGKVYSIMDMFLYKGTLSSYDEFIVNHEIQKLVLIFITSFLITLIYYSLKKIIGEYSALAAVLIILFEPMYVALSRVIHTDALLSLFIFGSYTFFYLGLKDSQKTYKNWNLYISAVLGSFALLTKSSALFLVGMNLLTLIYFYFKDKNKDYFKLCLFYIGLLVLGFILFWPAMWVSPMSSIKMYVFEGIKGTAIDEGHGHIWFGKETQNPGILFYPIAIIARYTPFLIIASILGFVYSKKFKYGRKDFAILSLIYALLFIVMISIPTKKLDRYSLPIIFPLAVSSALFIGYKFRRKWGASIILGVLLFRIILFYGMHPNYLAYYSPFVGGFDTGRYVIEPKWLIAYDEVAEYFNEKQSKEDDVIKVAIADHDYLRPFAKFEVLNIKHESERDQADYFVLPVYRSERNEFYKSGYDLDKSNDVITVAGVPYYEIYKNKGKF